MPGSALRTLPASARERFFETVLESATDYAIIVLDPVGHVTGWNSGAESILGWSRAEALRQPAALFFTPEDRAARVPDREMDDARRTGRAVDERWHLRKDGGRFWASGSMMPLQDEGSGLFEGYVKILRDRTAQRESEERLRASEEFTRRVLASAGDCIKVLDLDARLLAMSEGGMRVMEVEDFDTLRGCSWPDFWAGEASAEAHRAVEAARAGGAGRFQAFCPTLKGTPKWWDVQVTPILGADGRPERLLSVSRDITEQRRAEETALAEARRHEALLAVQRAISGSRDLAALFAAVTQGALDAVPGAEGSVIETLEGGDMAYVAAAGTLAATVGLRIRAAGSLSGRCVREGAPLLCADTETDPRVDRAACRSVGIRSMIVVPIPKLGEYVGVLKLAASRPDAFGERDLLTAQMLVGIIAAGFGSVAEAEAIRALRESEMRYRALALTSNPIVWTTDPDGQVEDMPLWRAYTGQGEAECRGWGWLDAIAPEDRARAAADWARAVETRTEYRTEYRICRHDGALVWHQARGVPVLEADGSIREWVGVCTDISDRKIAEEHQHLLTQELGHRLKNTLALVQAIAWQTLRNAGSVEEARAALQARLVALGKAHDILLEQDPESANVAAVAAAATALHGDGRPGRFLLRGPAVHLGPKAVLSLSLLLHELATNAVKYGALSVPDGRVTVAWCIGRAGDRPLLSLRWREHGGPPVAPPARKGFGSRLIERGFAGEIGGRVQLAFRPAGVVCTLTAPLADLQREA